MKLKLNKIFFFLLFFLFFTQYIPSLSYAKERYCPKLENLKNFNIQNIEPITDISIKIDYNCDTQVLFQNLVFEIANSGDNISNIESNQKVYNWINFIHKKVKNITPQNINILDEEKQMIMHPIKLIEIGFAKCGQHARLIVDGLIVLGVKSRVVQLNGHVVAEYFDENKKWIMVDLTYHPIKYEGFINKNFNLKKLIEGNNDEMDKYLAFTKKKHLKKVFLPKMYDQYNEYTPYTIKKTNVKINDLYFGWGSNNYEFCNYNNPKCHN